MAEILLFHHVCGLTDGVHAMAARWSEAGHVVHVPDLFDGKTFASIDDGVAYVEGAGFESLIERGLAAADGLPDALVYAGISLGVMPAQRLAQTRPGAAGAIFIEACAPLGAFADRWPSRVPVQIHGMDADPFFAGEGDLAAAQALVDSIGGDDAELFTYAGDRHLFTDGSLPSYDPDAAAVVQGRVIDFLSRVDERRAQPR